MRALEHPPVVCQWPRHSQVKLLNPPEIHFRNARRRPESHLQRPRRGVTPLHREVAHLLRALENSKLPPNRERGLPAQREHLQPRDDPPARRHPQADQLLLQLREVLVL